MEYGSRWHIIGKMPTMKPGKEAKTGRTRGETINTWAQTAALLCAGLWALYTFVHLNFTVPESAPVNVSVNLQLKKAGSATAKDALIAVEMKVVATNPSSRKIYLLPSVWLVKGDKIVTLPENENINKKLQEIANKGLNTPALRDVERHAAAETSNVVALGRLFSDTGLNPGESIQRSLVFHVPQDRYDLLEVKTFFPSSTKPDGIVLRWVVNKELIPSYELYRVDQNKKQTPVEPGQYSSLIDDFASDAELSLWDVPR
jgi:hypothetical protein